MKKFHPADTDMNNNTTLSRDLRDDWAPKWEKETPTPHSIQEKHSPTKIIKKKKRTNIRRRLLDVRIWKKLSEAERSAATEIANSFEMITKGIGYSSMKIKNEIPGTKEPNISELQAELMTTYMDWATNCTREGICHSIIIDILCYGLGCSQSDKLRKIKKGSSSKYLKEGLNLYCKMRGWA